MTTKPEDALVELSEQLSETAAALRGRRMLDHASRCIKGALAITTLLERERTLTKALRQIETARLGFTVIDERGSRAFLALQEIVRAALTGMDK